MLAALLDWLRELLGRRRATALRLRTQYPDVFEVEVVDARGRRVRTDGIPVTVQAEGATLTGRTHAQTAHGLAVFWTLTIHPVEDAMSITLTFASPDLAEAVSAPITLTPVASALAFVTAPPASAEDGRLFPQPVVLQVVSAKGNPVATAGVTVTASASGGGVLVGPATQTSDAQGRIVFPIGIDDPAI